MSEKVFNITSIPIPLISPKEIPTSIFTLFAHASTLIFVFLYVTKVTNFKEMFTGIIETLGEVKKIEKDQENLHITIDSSFTNELKIDQSVSHNGVCLTVVDINNSEYTVTAIKETLEKTNLDSLEVGNFANLERGMKLGDRLDGHIVQGHVDQTGVCIDIKDASGSTYYTFEYDSSLNNITIEKRVHYSKWS